MKTTNGLSVIKLFSFNFEIWNYALLICQSLVSYQQTWSYPVAYVIVLSFESTTSIYLQNKRTFVQPVEPGIEVMAEDLTSKFPEVYMSNINLEQKGIVDANYDDPLLECMMVEEGN